MAFDLDIARCGFRIRPAGEADGAAFRMLLPHVPSEAHRLVAVAGTQQLVVGAGAIARALRRKPPVGPGISLRVIKPCRRAGIGTALLEQLAEMAAANHCEALYAMRNVELTSGEMQAWKWMGFSPLESVEEHRLPLDEFEPRLAPLYERLRAAGRIPNTARIIPLYRADLTAVWRLHRDHLGGDRETIGRKLRGEGPGGFHPRYSRILMVDDQVVGCILAHRMARDIAVVDANILAPSVRNSWANIWLKLEATRGALSLGISQFLFTSFDHYTDTRSFTKKMGGATSKTFVLMFRPLKE